MSSHELVLGPQDGARVCGCDMPEWIFVGGTWKGDGYATWGRERCDRFPDGYHLERDGKYYHEYKLVDEGAASL
jgi:hypothetical protein